MLTDYDIMRVWDWGENKHPVDRALLLLQYAHPDATPDELAALTIGQRNGRLLGLRKKLFGSSLEGFARCAQCQEALEFSVAVETLAIPEPEVKIILVEIDELRLTARLPDSSDLAAIVGLDPEEAARRLMLERCIVSAESQGLAIPTDALPDSIVPILADAITDHDPQAEMRFALTCAACNHQWSALFDIVSFLWHELEMRAKRLLDEVHLLARTYGWHEADILQMSSRRRQIYLEMS